MNEKKLKTHLTLDEFDENIVEKYNKTNMAWSKIFQRLPILQTVDKGEMFEITAQQIKELGQREPRLMTKFDHKNNLPILFNENNLCILPNTRGSYLIGDFKAYEPFKFDETEKIKYIDFPLHYESISPEKVSSESVAMNIAYITGMIDKVLGSQINEAKMTLSGRMSSGRMDFKIEAKNKRFRKIQVVNSQMEIDATYESYNTIGIFESKQKLPQDFLIRQLYYPYYYINNLKKKKETKLFYFTYVDGNYNFNEYYFLDPYEYSSISQINQYTFRINDNRHISLEDIREILKKTRVEKEPVNEKGNCIPFPQANSMWRIIDLFNKIGEKDRTPLEITLTYGFVKRQTDYYVNALLYLGLIEKKKNVVSLSSIGKSIYHEEYLIRKKMMFLERILSKRVFNECIRVYIESNNLPDETQVIRIIKESVNTISDSTIPRRTSTVQRWTEWIINEIS